MRKIELIYRDLAKLLNLEEEATEFFVKRYKRFLEIEQKKAGNLTNRLISNGLLLIIRDIKQSHSKQQTKTILQRAKIKNECVLKHYKKILELMKLGYGAKTIVKYLKTNMHCKKISHPTIQKILNLVKGL